MRLAALLITLTLLTACAAGQRAKRVLTFEDATEVDCHYKRVDLDYEMNCSHKGKLNLDDSSSFDALVP